MSMESKTHSYSNTCITYNNLELTLPNDLKIFMLKSNLEQHNLRLWMSRLAYHTDKCSFTTKKIMRERKRDREKEKGRERKKRKRHRERRQRVRDFTVGRWNCLISVYTKNCTKIV